MATLKLNAQHAKQIDDALWVAYGGKLGGTELKQLARLFVRPYFLESLRNILKSALPAAGKYYRVELEVSIAWIDKHPLARLRSRNRRVELGDAGLFLFPILKNGPYINYRKARALLFQAKVAKTRGQLRAPSVPINPPEPKKGSSTELELDLLSRWDPFDLFKAAGSARPLVENLALPSTGTPQAYPAYAWFMATPRSTPRADESAAWTSPWMCGPAGKEAACDTSLGTLMARFFDPPQLGTRGTGSTPAGVDFDFNPAHIVDPNLSGKGWSRLCHELLKLAGSRNLPQHLCQDASVRPKATASVTVRSFPYLGFGDPESRDSEFTRPHSLGELLWRAWKNTAQWLWPRRFPLVIVTSVELEGESATGV